jgi:tetratricopeptide (TPR) repeat protein
VAETDLKTETSNQRRDSSYATNAPSYLPMHATCGVRGSLAAKTTGVSSALGCAAGGLLFLLSGTLAIAADRNSGLDLQSEPLSQYLEALQKAGRLPAESATVDRLRELVVEAEGLLVRGDARAATSLLFGVVQAPQFAVFRETLTFANAEFTLGRALARGHAYQGATRYLVSVLARGAKEPYFVPAYRTMVDMALENGRFAETLAAIDAAAPVESLPADSRDERAYLFGRAMWGQWQPALAAFSRVSEHSRLYPAALYFRALVAVERGDYPQAKAAFCKIADQKDQNKVSFNVDQRFFRLKDMARVALGRIAHEQGKYDEAYYYYFAVPEESERLNAALFEASWSMSQHGQFAAARAFADQFDKLFPGSPLRPDVSLLRANLAVKTCSFDVARTEATALVTRYKPVAKLAAFVRKDETAREKLLQRVLQGSNQNGHDIDGQLIEVLKLDDDFREMIGMLSDLELDLSEALTAVKTGRELGSLAAKDRKQLPAAASVEALKVLEDAKHLLQEARRDRGFAGPISKLILDASAVAYPVADAGPYEKEATQARELAERLAQLRDDTLLTLRGMVVAAIDEADDRLRTVLAQTRLVHIDAVVGKKKKLEIQIAALVQGRIPIELLQKMQAEGTISDDEIYWPFEGEQWADEYENYR